MTTHAIGRTTLLMVLAAVLLGATAFFIPAPVQVLVALLTLPLGAFLLSSATPS